MRKVSHPLTPVESSLNKFDRANYNRNLLDQIGLNSADYLRWKKLWSALCSHAQGRGAVCYLTFDQYVRLALDAGLTSPDQIGTQADKYQLGRLGDSGDYRLGNCRFITMKQNLEERALNGGNASAARKKSGRTKSTDAGVASQATKMLGRTKDSHDSIMSMALKAKDRFRRKFEIVSPDGTIYEGDCLTDFCEEHKLSRQSMHNVLKGKYKATSKGWTGKYL